MSRYKCTRVHRNMKESGKAASVVVKKYGNRRLYDTSGSRYVNLDDIAALIREGKDVKVVEAKTGEDLTRVTLTQIITEDAKEQTDFGPCYGRARSNSNTFRDGGD